MRLCDPGDEGGAPLVQALSSVVLYFAASVLNVSEQWLVYKILVIAYYA